MMLDLSLFQLILPTRMRKYHLLFNHYLVSSYDLKLFFPIEIHKFFLIKLYIMFTLTDLFLSFLHKKLLHIVKQKLLIPNRIKLFLKTYILRTNLLFVVDNEIDLPWMLF